jgi:hypothetical protein
MHVPARPHKCVLVVVVDFLIANISMNTRVERPGNKKDGQVILEMRWSNNMSSHTY